MASREETFTAKILVNDSEATNKLQKMQLQLEAVKRRRDEALRDGKIDVWKAANKEVDKLEKAVTKQKQLIDGLDHSLRNMSTANQKELETLVKSINKELTNGHVKRGTKEWEELNATLCRTKQQLRLIREEGQEQPNVWRRFFKFLNDSWGGVMILFQSVTGLSQTVRSSVQSFADMEEAMADTRKYTGLTDEAVRDLNEDLKKMDTRTPREKLNELAGAAGRLGKTGKQDILDFVEAGNMIQVALGDDLGEGAIDNVGKLAMAFGEDESKGLRGAMLATGSAVNELAQNSSAQAGYLVDFTARVAGFGKQLGLTQAQIMGFGAVMDENLLRDEMAATAFGNMLTKMQTDTEKFARIAGMGIKEFTSLLTEDANAAILAVADSLRSQDPQTMMKMLDDMGLDGSRAVGVLSTLADKIDDVRQRQELATKAYAEGTSVQKEYATMNSTVQAEIDKAKKQFQEMAIELGGKLMPVVKYTISSFALMTKSLSLVTSFALEHKTEIISATAAITAYTAVVNAKTMAEKAATVATKAMTLATELFNKATKLNPVGMVVAALTAATILFIKYRDRINGATEATSMLRQAGAKLMDIMQQVTGWMIELVKMAVKLYDRFSFVRKIIQLLTASFTAGFSTITIAVKMLIDELGGVATVIEGLFTLDWKKIKQGYSQGLKAVADAAVAQFNNVKRTVKEVFSAPPPPNGAKTVAAGEEAAKGTNELPDIVVTGKRKTRQSNYKSDADQKKEEQERQKREQEEKKRLKERADAAKASLQEQMAEEMLAYRQGISTYTDNMQERHNLTQNYYDQLKRIYGEDSNEFKKALLQQERDESEYYQWKIKQDDSQLLTDKLLREHNIRLQFAQQAVGNEDAMNEAIFQSDITYLKQKQNLYKQGSKEWIDIEQEIRQQERDHQFELERSWMQRLSQYRKETSQMDYDLLQKIELQGVETFYKALVDQGRMAREEYDAIIDHIKRKYAGLKAQQATGSDVQEKASKQLDNAKKQAGVKDADAGIDAATGAFSISRAVDNQRLVNEQLKQLYGKDYENNREYQEAKRQLDAETMQQVVAGAQAAYSTINSLMSAASSYAQACSDLEVAKITADYDRQIEAAGKNTKKREKLEKQKDEAIAKAKTKANKKAMVMEMAQAVAQTALGAISAYSSTMAGAPYPANLVLAPISAGIALAAGALQIATIKKQHEAEAAGYYEGGFTGGHRYRKEAGVVHEGEFVANHQAVNNRQLMPVFSLIDQAQRNNTVGSLTMQDVSRSMGAGGSTQIVTPIVNVSTDNEELRDALEAHREATDMLLLRLQDPIDARVVLTGPDGLNAQQKLLSRMLKNK